MSDNDNSINKYLHNPTFEWSFLHPKHWGTWIGIAFAALFAFMPVSLRDGLARKLSRFAIKKNGRVVRRARVNLAYCFPEKSEQERQEILEETFVKAAQYMLGYSEFLARSTKHNQNRGVMIGEENLLPLLDAGEKVIILAPHAWAVDYPAVMLAAKGYKVTTIMKPQRNPIGDWLMHVQRMQYGGRIFARDAGVKPFVRSIKDGYLGYWLPDEDFGEANSVFVPFFGTEKATLKGFGKMARLSKAKVVPVLPAYNDKTQKYEVHILPALENFPTGDEEADARAMNQAIEDLVRPHPEQYMWQLSLLKTRRDGIEIYDNSHDGDQEKPLPPTQN
ncbi:lauroyl-Kdo(2)-lipid IV(A) myristoyltransferase [Vibrio diazotrophicus]|uniref:Lipid A biosynthesis acyltransferase n=1 Tax=Vibrio diazotrophicus TaxID=685 RepID=A0A2J8HGJ9_VIBDI|nr:lauroyl-Kdo(2)-lipid IV(A) myristoyltransferase [Vibrio diazotrophicus]MCF7363471.1 lauroyl-Kdo(2)-lipid IV(A) myristoyltransferase [Vibrio sp. A1-b2]PNH97402.1 lauroyl-Kdo(2)-lipid IV(A) myristoyltransferase [Vibrio diazotrophicus]PNI04367.1 lauroyl-Kdo(2)-lipid IV(A) myristoyltransferase [Vibrio diazotrophicus]